MGFTHHFSLVDANAVRRIGWASLLLGACAGSNASSPEPVSGEESTPQTGVAPEAGARPPSPAAFESGRLLSVSGAPALGCEARAVGDWVQLSCSGLSYFGAFPWHVSAMSRVGSGPLTDAQKVTARKAVKRDQRMGHVSIVWRHTPGTQVDAAFVWFPHMVRFRATRPAVPDQGVELPTALGEFVGAPHGTAPELIRAVCACPPRTAPLRLLKGYTCLGHTLDSDSLDAWDPACLRHMQGADACQNMNECLTLEPSSFKACGADEVKSGGHPTTGCYKACSGELECPEHFECRATEAMVADGLAPGPTACFPADDAHMPHLQALVEYLSARP